MEQQQQASCMGFAALGMQGMMGLVVLLKFERASSSPGFESSRPAKRQAGSCGRGIPGCIGSDAGASPEKPSGALRVGKAGGLQAETGNWRQGGGEAAKWAGCPPDGSCAAAWADGGREDAARADACKDARIPGPPLRRRPSLWQPRRTAPRVTRPRSNAPMASRARSWGGAG